MQERNERRRWGRRRGRLSEREEESETKRGRDTGETHRRRNIR
jgi:hypothetical protein